jgi:hypothetical protein
MMHKLDKHLKSEKYYNKYAFILTNCFNIYINLLLTEINVIEIYSYIYRFDVFYINLIF